MSEVFENDIDQLDEKELLSLEDDNNEYHDSAFDGKFVYPSPLYKVKLEYSSEGVYATSKPEFDLQPGDTRATTQETLHIVNPNDSQYAFHPTQYHSEPD